MKHKKRWNNCDYEQAIVDISSIAQIMWNLTMFEMFTPLIKLRVIWKKSHVVMKDKYL